MAKRKRFAKRPRNPDRPKLPRDLFRATNKVEPNRKKDLSRRGCRGRPPIE